jgi:hypothetical protein
MGTNAVPELGAGNRELFSHPNSVANLKKGRAGNGFAPCFFVILARREKVVDWAKEQPGHLGDNNGCRSFRVT